MEYVLAITVEFSNQLAVVLSKFFEADGTAVHFDVG